MSLLLFSSGVAAVEGGALPEKTAHDLQAEVEFGYGHEQYSAPLVRFNDQGPLIEIVGRRQNSGNFRHVSGSAMKHFALSQDFSFQASAALWSRHFPDAADLDVGIFSADGLVRYQWGEASIGFGPSIQQIASGGRHFRDRKAIQLDWTYARENQGYTSIVLEIGDNRHSRRFRELDGRSGLLLLRRQFTELFRGVQEFSWEVGTAREVNRFGYADLANRQFYIRLGAGFETLGLEWNLGGTLQKARFDGPLLDELPARKEVFASADLTLSYAIARDIALRGTFSGYRNRANVVLYDGQFRGNSISLTASF